MGKASHHVVPIISILILHLYCGGKALIALFQKQFLGQDFLSLFETIGIF